MAKVKGDVKLDGVKKVTSIGKSKRSRANGKNAVAGCRAKRSRGQG